MLEKQERQCFYTKKVTILCVFLFFSLGGQILSSLSIENRNREAESTRREAIDDLEEGQGINERKGDTLPTLFILSQDGQEEATDEEINQLVRRYCLKHKQQIFWINEKGTAKITSPFLQKRWIVKKENDQEINKIENKIKNNGECAICRTKFKEMKNKRIFVYNCGQKNVPHMFCHDDCFVPWCQQNVNQKWVCPLCKRKPTPTFLEDVSKEDKIRQLKNTGNINYIEKNPQESSRWKLYLRNKYYDDKIGYEAEIDPDNWLIVNGILSDMEVLEINLNKPKDFEKYRITRFEGFNFHKVKFNYDQEPRETYLIFENETQLKIHHNGAVIFNERGFSTADHPTERMIKNKDLTRDISGRAICRYIYTKAEQLYRPHNHIFFFNKENIEYLKEKKCLVIFDRSLKNVCIGLEGTEIILKEEMDDIFITHGQIGLVCDNVNNFKAIKTSEYFIFSPIDLLKIDQINEMMKDGNKITITKNRLDLIGENCFLLPLFELNNIKETYLSLSISPRAVEREIGSHKKVWEGLKKMFTGVKIEGEKTCLSLADYAIVFLLYFNAKALNIFEILLIIPPIESNDIWDELTREKCSVLTNQTLKTQTIKRLSLKGECLVFAVKAKIMKTIYFRKLKMKSEKGYTKEDFVCNNAHLIMKPGLEELALISKAIKYLLYFKGINNLFKLEISISGLTREEYSWMLGVLERVRTKTIQFLLPNENCLCVSSFNEEKTIKALKNTIVTFGEGNHVIILENII